MAKVGALDSTATISVRLPIGDFPGGSCGYFAFPWKFCHLVRQTAARALLTKRSSWGTQRCVNDANARSKLGVCPRPLRTIRQPPTIPFCPLVCDFECILCGNYFFAQYSANAALDFKLSPDALWPPELSTRLYPFPIFPFILRCHLPLGCLLICCLRQLLSKSG